MASPPALVVGDQAPVALPADLPAHLTASLVADLDDGDAMATSSLGAALAAVPDLRGRRGRRHELTGVLAIAACACLTGATSYVAISEWAAAQARTGQRGRPRRGRPAERRCHSRMELHRPAAETATPVRHDDRG